MGWAEDIYGGIMNALNPALFNPNAAASLQLEQLRNFDFSSIPAEVGKLFSKRADAIKKALKFVSLAYRVSVDGSGQLVEPPLIEYSGVSETVKTKLLELLADLEFFEGLQDAEQAGVLQQSYLTGSWYDTSGKQIVVHYLPYQVVKIEYSDMWARKRGDIAMADRVELVEPIAPPTSTGLADQWDGFSLWVAKVVLTKTEAYIEYPDHAPDKPARVGLLAPDGSNPLGRIPLELTMRAKPTGSSSLPPIAEDVLNLTIGLILALSDNLNTIISQSHVKVMATGEGVQNLKELPNTADDVLVFKGDDISITALHLQPQTEKYIRVIETLVYYLYQTRYLRPEGFAGSIVTGAARREDAAGFHENRRRGETRLQKHIRKCVELIVAVANVRAGALSLTVPKMEIELRYHKTRENVLQEAQAITVLCSQGLRDIFKEVAREDGISYEAAEERVRKNVENWRSLFPATGGAAETKTPGLDKLAPEGQAEPTAAPSSIDVDAAPASDVAKLALNGAQASSLVDISAQVASGQMPIETAREIILASFPLDGAAVDKMLEPLRNFDPESTQTTLTPPKPKPTPEDD